MPFIWRRLKPETEKKLTADNQNKLKDQITLLSTRVEEQSKEVKETMDLVKGFLQSQKSNMDSQKMYGQFQAQQELRQVSDIQKDIRDVKTALKAGSIPLSIKSSSDATSDATKVKRQNKGSGEDSEKVPQNPAASQDPVSPEFTKIMEMVAKGITPPNVRTIDDSPLEDANQPIMDRTENNEPLAKPWEKNE